MELALQDAMGICCYDVIKSAILDPPSWISLFPYGVRKKHSTMQNYMKTTREEKEREPGNEVGITSILQRVFKAKIDYLPQKMTSEKK